MTKVLVLGFGMQGKAVVHDLEQGDLVSEIVVADMDLGAARVYLERKGYTRSRAVALDAAREEQLLQLIESVGPRVTICMLPADFNYPIARAALTAGCHFVSSSYSGRVAELNADAAAKGITILPEMGMDPGIDLVLGRLAVDELDVVHGMYSYGAGLPEPDCAGDNPLHYKITWTFDGVLKAYNRPARVLRGGQKVDIAGEEIFREEHGHTVEVAGLGRLEAYPNGDAIHYIQVFNLGPEVRDMGRFALRYPGHSRFWSVMAEMGFLDDTPLAVEGGTISPRQFLVRHLTPKLQFAEDERDMVVLRVNAWGLKDGRQRRVTYNLIDYRDLSTGLFAMNRTVGYTASIGARMILTGQITAPGVLSPTKDVPPRDLLRELKARGMKLDHRVEESEDV
ncbi:MAG: saccharopine dehydrogenase C-terminal domain-containing protein [Desulfobacterales bacterium]